SSLLGFIIHLSADILGTKKYSPPFVTVKLGMPLILFRKGVSGMVKLPSSRLLPTIGSSSVDNSTKLPSCNQVDLINSYWRDSDVQIPAKMIPLSCPSSSVVPSSRGGPYTVDRLKRRWIFISAIVSFNLSRGFSQRI